MNCFWYGLILKHKNDKLLNIIRLQRTHDMQTIVTDVRCVCLSVCLSVRPSVSLYVCHAALGFTVRGAAFVKSLWPLVLHFFYIQAIYSRKLLLPSTSNKFL